MNFRFYLLLFLISLSYQGFSQNDSLSHSRNVLYLEAAGAGGYGSLNFERTLYIKKFLTLAMRFGIGTYHLYDFTNKLNPDLLMPFSAVSTFGKNHKIEFSLGQVLTSIVNTEFTERNAKRKGGFHSYCSLGYRYQKNVPGLMFRCTYTPILEFNSNFRHWLGVSFGYAF